MLERLAAVLAEKVCSSSVDSCEHVVDEAARARRTSCCLGAGPPRDRDEPARPERSRRAGLVRSRRSRVPGGRGRAHPGRRSPIDAVRLFVDRATGARPRFRLARGERRSGGADLPRGSTGCRSRSSWPPRASMMSAEQIARRLDDCFRLLAAAARRRCRDTRRCGPRSTGATTCSRRRSGRSSADCRVPRRVRPRAAEVCRGFGSLPPDELLDTSGVWWTSRSSSTSGRRGRARGTGCSNRSASTRSRSCAASGEAERGGPASLRSLRGGWPIAHTTSVSGIRSPWVDRLERDHDNLRAALAWALDPRSHARSEAGGEPWPGSG